MIKHSNFLQLAALLFFATALKGQSYLSEVDNLYQSTYLVGDVEFGGGLYLDDGMFIRGSVSADGIGVMWDLNVQRLHQATYLDGYQTDFTMDGPFELWSGFSSLKIRSHGVANSWLHADLDLGDLTYASSDTPAFRIHEATDGTWLYPTIYFTGYDANTTWVWRQNGLAGMANSSLLAEQMTLSGNGNLTLTHPSGNDTLQIIPAGGNILASAGAAQLQTTAATAGNVSMITGNAAVAFHDNVGNTTSTLTPAGETAIYASGNQSLGFGDNVTVPGWRSFAFGNDLNAAYYGVTVMGDANAVPAGLASGNRTAWHAADPLFIIGNGDALDPLTIYKNGNARFMHGMVINGDTILNSANITLSGNVFLGADGTPGNVTTTLSAAKGEIPLLSN